MQSVEKLLFGEVLNLYPYLFMLCVEVGDPSLR